MMIVFKTSQAFKENPQKLKLFIIYFEVGSRIFIQNSVELEMNEPALVYQNFCQASEWTFFGTREHKSGENILQ